MKKFTFLFFFLPLLFSNCENNNQIDSETSSLNFVVSLPESNLKSTTVQQARFILFSITDKAGSSVLSNEKLELFNFNGNLISKPVSLKPGNYVLTNYSIIDSSNNVIYVCPKEGSAKAYLVKDPLNIDFSITKDISTYISPEVIYVGNSKPLDFGYASFTLNVINTFDFLVSLFTYSDSVKNLKLSNANLNITNGTIAIGDFSIQPKTNQLTLRSDIKNYTLTFSKIGYISKTITISSDSLKTYFASPLIVVLNTSDRLVIQSDTSDCRYAIVGLINPIKTYRGHMCPYAWTQNGILNVTRPLIDFKLQKYFNQGTIIKKATLFLYYSPYTPGSVHSGSNSFYIQNITTNWNEKSVTWNTQPSTSINQRVTVPASISSTQDYNIDVTGLIQEQLNNQAGIYGMMFQLVKEQAYNAAYLAAPDYIDVTKRPKLIIEY